jgi:hypothetical protein
MSIVIESVASEDMGELAHILAEAGVESIIHNVTREDIIGEGGVFIDKENGWGTRVVQTYTTPDNGLKIKYQVYLAGECAVDGKESA